VSVSMRVSSVCVVCGGGYPLTLSGEGGSACVCFVCCVCVLVICVSLYVWYVCVCVGYNDMFLPTNT